MFAPEVGSRTLSHMSEWAGTSDEELLATFARGERRDAAFAELVDRYERRVYGICYRYFGDHTDAQDATQDTFLTLVRRAGTFRGDSKLSTWIYRVAVNACNDLARKRARRPSTPVEDITALSDASAEGATEDEFAGRETARDVQQALAQLDDLSRTMLILVALEGQTYQEVAETLELPVGTVKSRVHRARAKLAELLGPLRDSVLGDGPPVAASDHADGTTVSGASGPRAPPA